MPDAADVKPANWSDDSVVIFDNGSYAAIWGRFADRSYKDLGVRWNGDAGKLGYPNAFGRPQWYVEYQPLQVSVLLGIKERLLSSETTELTSTYLDKMNTAIEEAMKQRPHEQKSPASE